jgi:hypothetical protein
MMYQQNTQGKQPTNEFFGTRTQLEQRIMPSALSFYLGSCPFIQLFSCPDRKRFEIVALGSGSANGDRNV